jgi:uncharacterized protein
MSTSATEALPPTATGGLSPTEAKDRIFQLDMLRGWAILGILAVNAMAFAWPIQLEMSSNLELPWMAEPANRLAHWVVQVFFQDKFRTLFSMLFGVSVFLVGGERSDKARGRLLRRRLFWLAVFGALHGLALWFGDILLLYAWGGVFMMLCRSWTARRLLLVGGLVVGAFCVLQGGFGLIMANLPPEAAAQMQAGQPQVTVADIEAAIASYRSGLVGALTLNAGSWALLQGLSMVLLVWPTLGLMMVGLGLFKTGFLSGRSPTWVYLAVLLLGAGNLAVLGWLDWREIHAGVGADPTGGLAGLAGAFAILITLGYVSLLILMTRFGLRAVTGVLAPVGRMAFTNYLTQTLIMTTIFYMPWGPRLFGSVDQAGLWAIVGAIWVAQLIWSPLWLSAFTMGPFEWVWRCLTYGRRVPIRR